MFSFDSSSTDVDSDGFGFAPKDCAPKLSEEQEPPTPEGCLCLSLSSDFAPLGVALGRRSSSLVSMVGERWHQLRFARWKEQNGLDLMMRQESRDSS